MDIVAHRQRVIRERIVDFEVRRLELRQDAQRLAAAAHRRELRHPPAGRLT
jgi:hypothetical protein